MISVYLTCTNILVIYKTNICHDEHTETMQMHLNPKLSCQVDNQLWDKVILNLIEEQCGRVPVWQSPCVLHWPWHVSWHLEVVDMRFQDTYSCKASNVQVIYGHDYHTLGACEHAFFSSSFYILDEHQDDITYGYGNTLYLTLRRLFYFIFYWQSSIDMASQYSQVQCVQFYKELKCRFYCASCTICHTSPTLLPHLSLIRSQDIMVAGALYYTDVLLYILIGLVLVVASFF